MADEARGQVKNVADQARNIAQTAVENPEHAEKILELSLRRVFRRGNEFVNEVDRAALVDQMVQRTGMTPEQVTQQIAQWEERFEQVRAQTAQAREAALQRANELRQDAERRAEEIYNQAQARFEAMQTEARQVADNFAHEAEERAREAAQKATNTLSQVAAGIVFAMFLGAVASGIGGYFGAPDDLPSIDADELRNTGSMIIVDIFDR